VQNFDPCGHTIAILNARLRAQMLPLKWAKLGSVTALSVPRPTSAHIRGDVVPILGISKFPKPGVLPWSDDAGTQSNFSQNDDQRTMKFLAPLCS